MAITECEPERAEAWMAEIVAHRPDLAAAPPPFAVDALRTITGDHGMDPPRQMKRQGGASGSSASTPVSGSGR